MLAGRRPTAAWPDPTSPIYICRANIPMAAASPRSPSGRLPPGGGRAVLAGQRPTGRLARRELTYIYIYAYICIYIYVQCTYTYGRGFAALGLSASPAQRRARPARGPAPTGRLAHPDLTDIYQYICSKHIYARHVYPCDRGKAALSLSTSPTQRRARPARGSAPTGRLAHPDFTNI